MVGDLGSCDLIKCQGSSHAKSGIAVEALRGDDTVVADREPDNFDHDFSREWESHSFCSTNCRPPFVPRPASPIRSVIAKQDPVVLSTYPDSSEDWQ
jgi:hypothetical protein